MAKKNNTWYKHRTAVFGTDAERYVSRLFLMMMNPNGSRRPDLISVLDNFDPRLSIEVKSGKANKGVLTEYQLHYGLTSLKDYEDIVRESMGERNETLVSLEEMLQKKDRVAYYYDVINRTDGLGSEEVGKKYSQVMLRWGDQHLVPHEYAFYAFAAARVMRTGEKMKNVVKALKKVRIEDALYADEIDYDRRKDTQHWQNIHARDMLSIFHDDPSITTKKGVERVKLISDFYPVETLDKIRITGPNNTFIYILADSKDHELFDAQLRKVVNDRVLNIEQITREREESCPLVAKPLAPDPDFFSKNGHKRSDYRTKEEEDKLIRLSQWLAEGEVPVDMVPF